LFLDSLRVFLVFKGKAPLEHFTEQDTIRPDICLEGVSLVADHQYLRSSVADGATVGVSAVLVLWVKLLCEAKVYKLYMTVLVNHYVLRFQVSIYDLISMKDVESLKNFGSIEFDPLSLVSLLST
jgi:hypothetical protein